MKENIRRVIISLCLFMAVTLHWDSLANAIPQLQLFIPGATYDTNTQTWVFQFTPGVPFILQVISANKPHDNVQVSFALSGIGKSAPLPSDVIINIDGVNYTMDNFIWGKPNLLPSHGIFPAHHATRNAGDFGTGQTVCNMAPGNEGDCSNRGGEIKNLSVAIFGTTPLHFDAYTYVKNKKGKREITFAPFSHDALVLKHKLSIKILDTPSSPDTETTPNMGRPIIALFGTGLVGILGYTQRRFRGKS